MVLRNTSKEWKDTGGLHGPARAARSASGSGSAGGGGGSRSASASPAPSPRSSASDEGFWPAAAGEGAPA